MKRSKDQLELFNTPKVQHDAPDTSRTAAAASAQGASELEATILALFADAKTFTDDEIVDAMTPHRHRWDGSSVKSARSRLSGRGELIATVERRPSLRSKPQIVWTKP